MKLHRIHASAQATRLQFDELERMHWRAEGGKVSLDEKASIARRLAVCWNLCEGIPTDLLEKGFIRDFFQAVHDGDLAKAQALDEQIDRGTDRTDGRLHDCSSCLKKEAPAELEEGAEEPEPAPSPEPRRRATARKKQPQLNLGDPSE